VSLRSGAIEHELTLPDGRTALLRVGMANDGYIPPSEEETVVVELRIGRFAVAALNTVLDPTRRTRRRSSRASSSRACSPVASSRQLLRSSSTLTDSDEPGDSPHEHGRHRGRAVRRPRAEDRGELQEARRRRLLRRRHLPPRHPGLHDPGRRPDGTGLGGPGYTFEDEFNDRSVERGALAMANSGPNTNGSQFFIVTADAARGSTGSTPCSAA
jgi:hypothetical protein